MGSIELNTNIIIPAVTLGNAHTVIQITDWKFDSHH